MPGRRRPKIGPEEAYAVHARAAFLGALDGGSYIPSPLSSAQSGAGSNNRAPTTLFWNDEFVCSGSGYQAFPLTYLPILHSEHVYLCWQNAAYGAYQRETVAWVRDPGSRMLTVLESVYAQSGDVLVVEYAYYDQAPAPPTDKIWWALDA